MKILTYPNKKLKQKSHKVRKVDEEIRQLAYDMLKIMKVNKGVGLSAIQVDKPIKLVVTGYEPPEDANGKTLKKLKDNEVIPTLILINPKITKKSRETDIMEEGCLSLPNIEVPVKRSIKANILATDLEGHRIKIRAKGLFARVLLHEIDHLDGILITDHGRPVALAKNGRVDKKGIKKT